jgi:hypothetical protein
LKGKKMSKKTITLYLPKETAEKIRSIAAGENRSVTGQITHILKKYIEKQKGGEQ